MFDNLNSENLKNMKINEEDLKIINQEDEPISCELCRKQHVCKIYFPGCHHLFGKKCLANYFLETLEKNNFF